MSQLLNVYMFRWNRETLKEYQASQDSLAHWTFHVAWIGSMSVKGGGIVAVNNDYVGGLNWLYGWKSRKKWDAIHVQTL